MTPTWKVWSYEGSTSGGWSKFSVCKFVDAQMSNDHLHECGCEVHGPDVVTARAKAERICALLNAGEEAKRATADALTAEAERLGMYEKKEK